MKKGYLNIGAVTGIDKNNKITRDSKGNITKIKIYNEDISGAYTTITYNKKNKKYQYVTVNTKGKKTTSYLKYGWIDNGSKEYIYMSSLENASSTIFVGKNDLVWHLYSMKQSEFKQLAQNYSLEGITTAAEHYYISKAMGGPKTNSIIEHNKNYRKEMKDYAKKINAFGL